MPNWAKRFFSYFYSIRGRANRKTFWLTYFAVLAIILGILLIENVVVRYVYPNVFGTSMRGVLDISLLAMQILIYAFIFSIPTIVIRRLHDLNINGYWLIAYIAALIFLVGIAIAVGNSTDAAVLQFEYTVTAIALFVVGLIPGTPRRNKFGEPQLSRKPAAGGA
jgi:uncharacterized membrane protein YhaH (DUF805 family)